MLCAVGMFAQNSDSNQSENTDQQTIPAVAVSTSGQESDKVKMPDKLAINVGVLMGGGSIVGADLEYMPASRVGIQAGMGISSFGFGLNYHLQDRINSSFLSFQYWHQGFGSLHFASYVGPMFVFRARKIFQAGVGIGAVVNKGPAFNLDPKVNAILLYNIGLYFPL